MSETALPCRNAASPQLAMRIGARHAVKAVIDLGAAQYRRQTCLPSLLPLVAAELADDSEATRRRIVARLARALRAERMRGRARHWTYDLNRHIALHQAYEGERQHLPPGPRAPS